jgi:fumarylacetoacetase
MTADETHSPELRSWVEGANERGCDFPIQNLPLGVGRVGRGEQPRLLVPIGSWALDLEAALRAGLLDDLPAELLETCGRVPANALMSLQRRHWKALRLRLSYLLRSDGKLAAAARRRRADILVPLADVEPVLPAAVGDYTDFYASLAHAYNVGRMFRPDRPLLPNYKWVPIAYHGRASTLLVSGAAVRRPWGQVQAGSAHPAFRPSERLDYEAEVGFYIGTGNFLGEPLTPAQAEDCIFGVCLLNDWSARDIQVWEYQPLGPFLSKNFATSLSPWIVTWEALAPFRLPMPPRPAGDPDPLPYLALGPELALRAAVSMRIEVFLRSRKMRESCLAPLRLSSADLAELYWSPLQLLVHHASNGCLLRPGDLLGSGTVSGAIRGSEGCLLELARRGEEPVRLPSGEERSFLEDGDEVIIRARCEREGFVSIGIGECVGVVQPAGSFFERDMGPRDGTN